MPFNIGPGEIIIILVIALIVVGPGKLPDVGSALGKSIREFRKAATDVKESTSLDPAPSTPAGQVTAPSAVAAVPPVAAAAPAPVATNPAAQAVAAAPVAEAVGAEAAPAPEPAGATPPADTSPVAPSEWPQELTRTADEHQPTPSA